LAILNNEKALAKADKVKQFQKLTAKRLQQIKNPKEPIENKKVSEVENSRTPTVYELQVAQVSYYYSICFSSY
jgi:hypothetical protein